MVTELAARISLPYRRISFHTSPAHEITFKSEHEGRTEDLEGKRLTFGCPENGEYLKKKSKRHLI